MEQVPKNTPEYNLILNEYEKVKYNITREKDFNRFLGGLPITLEKKDIFNVMSKDKKNYNYSITQKADGTRYLMFISYKPNKLNNERCIVFIDRNNDFFILKNNKGETLPNIESPRMLIDGELIAYNQQDEQINISNNKFDFKSFCFLSFDIIYGPASVELEGSPEYRKLNLGTESSMAGPIGGKMWSYERRYNILYSLLFPLESNEFKPPITIIFSKINWFVPEIKPIYFINSIFQSLPIYQNKLTNKSQKQGFFQQKLQEFRNNYYYNINLNKEEKYKVKSYPIKLDGLIFTPLNTEYRIGGAWKKFMNIQYKWKPADEQTIDFAIKKDSKKLFVQKYSPIRINKNEIFNKLINNTICTFNYDKISDSLNILEIQSNYNISKIDDITNMDLAQKIIDDKIENINLNLVIEYDEFNNIFVKAKTINSLYILKKSILVEFKIDGKNIEYLDNLRLLPKKQKDITIGEFKLNFSKTYFELVNLRLDKTKPNSINTANNVYQAIINPVDIEILKQFFILYKLDKSGLSKLLKYMTLSQLNRLALTCSKKDLFVHEILGSKYYEIKQNIIKNIDLFKKNLNYEFEIRLGFIEKKKFQNNIPFIFYQQFMDLMSLYNSPYEYNNYVDYISENYRSRYLYVQDINNLVHLSTIKKENIENIDIDTKFIFNFDLRFSLSDEQEINTKIYPNLLVNKSKNYIKLDKKRYSFKFNIFNIDFTEIKNVSKESISNENVNYSIEIEIIDRDLITEQIINHISNTLINILNKINS